MLTKWQTKAIQAYQSDELERLVSDREMARWLAKTALYASIAEWLVPDVGGRVLECGCGPGRFVAMLAQLGYEVVGVDPYEFPTWQLIRNRLNVELLSHICVESLPFADHSFRHVACLGALLYFEQPEKALSEMRRVLRPGGRLVLRTVNRTNLYTRMTGRRLDPASRNLYTERELVELIERAGFRVTRSFTYGFWPPALTNFWWYLVNGKISPQLQDWLSRRVSARNRVNITVFAERTA